MCLLGALLVSACSESETPTQDPTPPGDSGSSSATTTPGPDGEAGTSSAPEPADTGSATATTAPADDAASTSGAPAPGDGGSTTAAPTGTPTEDAEEEESVGAVALEDLQPRVNSLLETAGDSRAVGGSEARDLRNEAFGRTMRFVTLGEEEVREADVSGATYDPFVDPADGNVLAISSADGEVPWYSLVQTVPGGGATPVLTLVRGSDEDDVEDSVISWSAQMLPGTEVGTFAPRGQGSALLRDPEDTGLSAQPQEVLEGFVGYLDYPDSGSFDLGTNGYAPQVRGNAEAQAQEVAGEASLEITNEIEQDSVTTLELADGSALTFAAIDRTARFAVNEGSILTPPDTVSAFIPEGELTEYAEVDSIVLAAIRIPADEGRPELIAVAEQVIGAEGD